jgi:hypothetical protein
VESKLIRKSLRAQKAKLLPVNCCSVPRSSREILPEQFLWNREVVANYEVGISSS